MDVINKKKTNATPLIIMLAFFPHKPINKFVVIYKTVTVLIS